LSDLFSMINVHSPESSGNSNVQSLCLPGPRLVTPSIEVCLTPVLLTMYESNSPTGTGASLETEIVVKITSSSSSLISIRMSTTSAFRGPLFPIIEVDIVSTYTATYAAILEANRGKIAILDRTWCWQEVTNPLLLMCESLSRLGFVCSRVSK